MTYRAATQRTMTFAKQDTICHLSQTPRVKSLALKEREHGRLSIVKAYNAFKSVMPKDSIRMPSSSNAQDKGLLTLTIKKPCSRD